MTFISHLPTALDWMIYGLLGPATRGEYVVIEDERPSQACLSRAFYDHGWQGTRIHQNAQTQQEKMVALGREQHCLISSIELTSTDCLPQCFSENRAIHLWITSSLAGLEHTARLLSKSALRPWLIVAQKTEQLHDSNYSALLTSIQSFGYELITLDDQTFCLVAQEQVKLLENIRLIANLWPHLSFPLTSYEAVDLRLKLKQALQLQKIAQEQVAQSRQQSTDLQNQLGQIQAQLHEALVNLNDGLISHKSFSQLIKAALKRVIAKLSPKIYSPSPIEADKPQSEKRELTNQAREIQALIKQIDLDSGH